MYIQLDEATISTKEMRKKNKADEKSQVTFIILDKSLKNYPLKKTGICWLIKHK